MTVTIHHLEQSRSQRIIWLLEELGIDYEIKVYKRDAKSMYAPPELQEIHPLGKSPVVTDGSTVVAESGAVCRAPGHHSPKLPQACHAFTFDWTSSILVRAS